MRNGRVEVINNIAYYKCNEGFVINIPNYASGRRCTKASKWEGNIKPQCISKCFFCVVILKFRHSYFLGIYCGYPGYIVHGRIVGKSYYYLDTIKYECFDGYDLMGSSTRTCTENGLWLPEKPSCIGK